MAHTVTMPSSGQELGSVYVKRVRDTANTMCPLPRANTARANHSLPKQGVLKQHLSRPRGHIHEHTALAALKFCR